MSEEKTLGAYVNNTATPTDGKQPIHVWFLNEHGEMIEYAITNEQAEHLAKELQQSVKRNVNVTTW